MKLIPLSCQSCGAQLNLNLQKLIAYCPYCGCKLLIDIEQLGTILSEKEKTQRVAIKEAAEVEKTKIKAKAKVKEDENKSFTISFIALSVVLLGIMYFLTKY